MTSERHTEPFSNSVKMYSRKATLERKRTVDRSLWQTSQETTRAWIEAVAEEGRDGIFGKYSEGKIDGLWEMWDI